MFLLNPDVSNLQTLQLQFTPLLSLLTFFDVIIECKKYVSVSVMVVWHLKKTLILLETENS